MSRYQPRYRRHPNSRLLIVLGKHTFRRTVSGTQFAWEELMDEFRPIVRNSISLRSNDPFAIDAISYT